MADEKDLKEEFPETETDEILNEEAALEGDVVDAEELSESFEEENAEACDGNEEQEAFETEGETAGDEAEAAEENSSAEGGNGKHGKEKKPFFRKDKKDPRDEKIAELTDRLQRLMAEFDNYRKRTEKEKAQSYDNGFAKAVEKLLPILDSFEYGFKSASEEELKTPAYEGMDKIYKQMLKILNDNGVEPIEAEGKEFDANLHYAVMQVPNEELPENTVVAELQKGYTYKGNVVRYTTVSVSTK